MKDKRYDSLKSGQQIYWRFRKDGRGYKVGTVCTISGCPSLIDIRNDDPISAGVTFITVDPMDIDYYEVAP
jgi:hypothetical protein